MKLDIDTKLNKLKDLNDRIDELNNRFNNEEYSMRKINDDLDKMIIENEGYAVYYIISSLAWFCAYVLPGMAVAAVIITMYYIITKWCV